MTPIFTKEELRRFFEELWTKFRYGVRSPEGMLYTTITLIGVGWASWTIPAINNSELSPETLGIYVIGFLLSVTLDAAMIAWKYKGSNTNYETAILVVVGLGTFILIIASSYFAIKPLNVDLKPPQREDWRWGATPSLLLILMCAIIASLIVSGMDTKPPEIGPLDNPITDLTNRSAPHG